MEFWGGALEILDFLGWALHGKRGEFSGGAETPEDTVYVLNFTLLLDEKEKYDPSSFRDQIVAGLNEVNADLEQVSGIHS